MLYFSLIPVPYRKFFSCYVRFKLHLKPQVTLLLDSVLHQIRWLCVVEERSFLWKMCATTIGRFLALIRSPLLRTLLKRCYALLEKGHSNITGMFILQFGLFGICDGHGGAAAAKSASKLVFPLLLKFGGKIDLLKPHSLF